MTHHVLIQKFCMEGSHSIELDPSFLVQYKHKEGSSLIHYSPLPLKGPGHEARWVGDWSVMVPPSPPPPPPPQILRLDTQSLVFFQFSLISSNKSDYYDLAIYT